MCADTGRLLWRDDPHVRAALVRRRALCEEGQEHRAIRRQPRVIAQVVPVSADGSPLDIERSRHMALFPVRRVRAIGCMEFIIRSFFQVLDVVLIQVSDICGRRRRKE